MTPVSELLATQIRLAVVELQNAELHFAQLQARAQQLIAQRDAWIEQARMEVHAPAGHSYNLDTRLFESPNGPAPLSKPAKKRRVL